MMLSELSKKLTPSEQALWNTLCDHRGQAVTRGQLLAVVGYPAGISTRTLDVHIQHLRRKMGQEARIETVFRIGYRLAV